MPEKFKTKHIVKKTSTRHTINNGVLELEYRGGSVVVTADGSCSVRIDMSYWLDATDLRATAKLFKKLADALEREEVL